jgi:hypothetical protein
VNAEKKAVCDPVSNDEGPLGYEAKERKEKGNRRQLPGAAGTRGGVFRVFLADVVLV